MDPVVLLNEIQATLASAPEVSTYSPMSPEHMRWLGKAGALINRWSPVDMVAFRRSEIMLGSAGTRSIHFGRILTLLHRAEADLSLSVPSTAQQVFGPGAVYDFFQALRDIVGSASTSLLVVDPYLDDSVFEEYLSNVGASVTVRLLVRKHASTLKVAAEKWQSQTGHAVELRKSQQLHDRILIVDASSCWVLGQSIKDAASKGPTYLAPLSGDAAVMKREAYELVWQSGTPL